MPTFPQYVNAALLGDVPSAVAMGGSWGPAWAVATADCVKLLNEFPPECVDLAFCDPPYFLSNGGSSVRGGQRVSVDKGAWDVGQDAHEILRWHEVWLRAVQRVLKPSGTLWVSTTRHSLFAIGFAQQRAMFHSLNVVTWKKKAPPPNLGCRTLTESTEFLIWSAPRHITPLPHFFAYNELRTENGGKQLQDVWEFAAPRGAEGAEERHPAQKPLALLERIVRMSSQPGDLVLDPFCGHASTGVSAISTGRRFIGIDADAECARVSAKRLEKVKNA